MAVTLTPKKLYKGQPGTTSTTLYTVANTVGKYAIVTHIAAANVTASAATLTMHAVPTGGSASGANMFIPGVSIPGFTVVFFDVAIVLEQDESLRALIGTASAITLTVSGVIN